MSAAPAATTSAADLTGRKAQRVSPSPSQLDGKPLALLLIEAGDNDNEDLAVMVGVAKYDGKQLVLDRGKDKPPFVVRDEWVSRIRPVPDSTSEIFGGGPLLSSADYWSITTGHQSSRTWIRSHRVEVAAR